MTHPRPHRIPGWLRVRLPYLALGVGTTAVGLAVHSTSDALSPVVRDVVGDALWAAMVTWWIGAVAPAIWVPWRAASALGIAYAVEFSQLYRAPALDALRGTFTGRLLLGSGFDARDLASYGAGVLAALSLEWATRRR